MKRVEATRKAIRKRVEGVPQKANLRNRYFETSVIRATWLTYKEHPLAGSYRAWLVKEIEIHRDQLTKFFDKTLPAIKIPHATDESGSKQLSQILQEIGEQIK